MPMHPSSVVLLSSDSILRTAERSFRLPNAMMTARDFLPPRRPCLSAPTATAWLDNWPGLLFTLSSSSSSVSSPSSFRPVHLEVRDGRFREQRKEAQQHCSAACVTPEETQAPYSFLPTSLLTALSSAAFQITHEHHRPCLWPGFPQP